MPDNPTEGSPSLYPEDKPTGDDAADTEARAKAEAEAKKEKERQDELKAEKERREAAERENIETRARLQNLESEIAARKAAPVKEESPADETAEILTDTAGFKKKLKAEAKKELRDELLPEVRWELGQAEMRKALVKDYPELLDEKGNFNANAELSKEAITEYQRRKNYLRLDKDDISILRDAVEVVELRRLKEKIKKGEDIRPAPPEPETSQRKTASARKELTSEQKRVARELRLSEKDALEAYGRDKAPEPG